MKYIIKDWAGNVLNFKGRFQLPCFSVAMEFDDFESGWSWIYEKFPSQENFDDYFVEEKI